MIERLSSSRFLDVYSVNGNVVLARKGEKVPDIEWKDPFERAPPTITVVLQLTWACPLSCDYCFVKSLSEMQAVRKMQKPPDLEGITSSLERVISWADWKKISVIFHGGEPLLFPSAIEEIKNQFREKRIRFGIQTSGWGLEENYDVLRGVDVGLSIDDLPGRPGPRDSGPGWKAVEFLREKGRGFGVITVVNRYNQGNLYVLFRKLLDMGAKNFVFNPVYHTNRDFYPDMSLVGAEFRRVLMYYVENSPKAEVNPFAYWAERSFGKPSMLCYDGFCGGGKRIVAIAPDGKIYPCDTFSGVDMLEMGAWMDKRDMVLGVARGARKRLGCDLCKYNRICRGPCAGKYHIYGNEAVRMACNYYKTLLDLMFSLVARYPALIFLLAREYKSVWPPTEAMFYEVPG